MILEKTATVAFAGRWASWWARLTTGLRMSGAAFHRAYHRVSRWVFMEAHEHACKFLERVFAELSYDNRKGAVRRILARLSSRRDPCFIAFRWHWRFPREVCLPCEAHRKAGVKARSRYLRHNHCLPMLKARDLGELNAELLAARAARMNGARSTRPHGGGVDDR